MTNVQIVFTCMRKMGAGYCVLCLQSVTRRHLCALLDAQHCSIHRSSDAINSPVEKTANSFGFLGKGTFDYNAPSAEIFRFGNWGRAGKGLLLLQISILKETRGHFIAIFSEHQSGFGLVH